MRQPTVRRAPPSRREQLELLRLQGARHRLELALAQEQLRSSVKDLARGPRFVLLILRALLPRISLGTEQGAFRGARWIIPLVGALLLGTRFGRTVRRLRTALAAGTLAAVLYRFVRRRYRERKA